MGNNLMKKADPGVGAKPKTRLQNLLARIAGQTDYKEINPKTKSEHYLSEIAENGGGSGGSGSGPLLVNIVPDQEYPDSKVVMDKTIGEIKEAFASGRNIVCKRDYALTNKDTGETISFSEYGLVLSIWPFESAIFVGSGNMNYGSFEPMKFGYDFDDNSYPHMWTSSLS